MQEYETVEMPEEELEEIPTMDIPFVIPASAYHEVPEATMEIMNTILMLQGAAHNGSPFGFLSNPLKEAIGGE